MDTKKIVMGVISVAVAIIVLMSMIPIFTDAGASEDTFKNEGYFYVNKVTEGTTTISFDYTNPSVLTVNDEEYTFEGMPSDITVALTESSFLRFQPGTRCILYTSDSSYAGGTTSAKSLTISATDGTMTVNLTGSDPATITYTDLYVISDSGEYVMKKSNESAYVLSDTVFFGAGRSTIGTSDSEFLMLSGTVEDGATFTTLRGSENTFTTPVIDATAIAGHEDLYDLSKVTTTATNSTGSSNLTYSYFIVPAEVTAERSVHASPVESTLIGLIPLLMMVGILLTAIGLFIAKYRKN